VLPDQDTNDDEDNYIHDDDDVDDDEKKHDSCQDHDEHKIALLESSAINTHFILISSSGQVYISKVIACDVIKDISMLHIEAVYCTERSKFMIPAKNHVFPFVPVCDDDAKLTLNMPLLCVGQPVGRNYPTVDISEGKFKGVASKSANLLDNYEIGQLKHDCWTYWGHSGAALMSLEGVVVGLHSSWDDKTAMRRGIHLKAIQAFLNENKHLIQ
jgi:hypothetical protein